MKPPDHLVKALEADPDNRDLQLMWADFMEEAGDSAGAAIQRDIARGIFLADAVKAHPEWKAENAQAIYGGYPGVTDDWVPPQWVIPLEPMPREVNRLRIYTTQIRVANPRPMGILTQVTE